MGKQKRTTRKTSDGDGDLPRVEVTWEALTRDWPDLVRHAREHLGVIDLATELRIDRVRAWDLIEADASTIERETRRGFSDAMYADVLRRGDSLLAVAASVPVEVIDQYIADAQKNGNVEPPAPVVQALWELLADGML